MTVGENIRVQRKCKGLTQKQLSELVGLASSTIAQYELGLNQPRVPQIQKIANALGISPIRLISTEQNNTEINKKGQWSCFEQKLAHIGFSIDSIEAEGYIWLNYPDGTLEVTQEDLSALNEKCDSFLRFALTELKEQRAKDFRHKK